MKLEMMIGIAVIVALAASCVVLVCLYLKDRTKEEIRADVYKLFLEAEHRFEHGENTLKFEYVVHLARSLLPSWMQVVITEPFLEAVFRKVIQRWFEEIKDLLDDGKRNGSLKEQGVADENKQYGN